MNSSASIRTWHFAAAPRHTWPRLTAVLLAAAVWVALPRSSHALVPTATAVEGLLQGASGAPAPDGKYDITFQIYGQDQGGAAVWKENQQQVTVKSGQFAVTLGSIAPLSASLLGSLPQVWLGVSVGADPELPRKALLSVPFSLRAAVAEGVDCSGCVGINQLDPKALSGLAKVSDLGAYAQKTDLADYIKAAALAKVAGTGQYADLLGAPKLADVAATGAYADLLNVPTLPKLGTACGSGLVMRGIKADGSYDCVSGAASAASLPPDGLDEVSNGLLTNQFTEIAASTATPVAIPDFLGAGVSDAITVPDFGIAQGLAIAVTLTSSDTSKVRIDLYDPLGNKTTIYNGTKAGTKLDFLLQTPNATLDAWVGKNPKGLWSINVADLAPSGVAKDGAIQSWQVQVQTLSSKKVAVKGGLQFYVADAPPVPCTPSTMGMSYVSSKDKALYICSGTDWAPFYLSIPGTATNPAYSCKDMLAKAPSSKDGVYWLSGGGATAFQAWCDMTTDGGGWTLAFKVDGNKSTFAYDAPLWTDANVYADSAPNLDDTEAKLKSASTVAFTQVRIGLKYGGATNWLTINQKAASLSALFGGGFVATSFGRNAWKALIAGGSAQPNCNLEGFNSDCAGRKVRIGLLTNQENDCQSCDSYLGIGHTGQGGCGGQGASWAGCMASCSPDNGDKNLPAMGYILVR